MSETELLEEIKDTDPPPCAGCFYYDTCAKEEICCQAFSLYARRKRHNTGLTIPTKKTYEKTFLPSTYEGMIDLYEKTIEKNVNKDLLLKKTMRLRAIASRTFIMGVRSTIMEHVAHMGRVKDKSPRAKRDIKRYNAQIVKLGELMKELRKLNND